MSSHEVKVVRITEISQHPNADRMELVKVWGYVCAVGKSRFKVGDLAVYVEPDYIVPVDRPEFQFLFKVFGIARLKHRITVKRLRGVYSEGLLIPAPIGSNEGDNVMDILGITRYEPGCAWWKALEQNPWIEDWCKNNPGVVLYGEVYGPGVQAGFHYGKSRGQYGFAVFDVLKENNWVINTEFNEQVYDGLQFVPTLYSGPHDPTMLVKLAELDETFNSAGHVREGVVVKLHNERTYPTIGRVALKFVSNRYLGKE